MSQTGKGSRGREARERGTVGNTGVEVWRTGSQLTP